LFVDARRRGDDLEKPVLVRRTPIVSDSRMLLIPEIMTPLNYMPGRMESRWKDTFGKDTFLADPTMADYGGALIN
jgi:hypothetical protein